MEQIGELLGRIPRQFYVPILLGCIGLILLVYGSFAMLGLGQSREKMSFESASQAQSSSVLGTENANTISVDVEGAVASPSVVLVPVSARIQDAIQAAGGLSTLADKEWVSKHLNMAAKLTDGAKIYIPKVGEFPVGTNTGLSANTSEGIQDSSKQINVNSATESELDSLPGIGPVTAQKIINGRPYSSIEDLTIKKIVSNSVYQKIKDMVVAY